MRVASVIPALFLTFLVETGAAQDAAESGSPEPAAPVSQEASSVTPRAMGSQPLAPRALGEPVMEVPYSTLFRNTNITTTSATIQPTVNPAVHADPFEFQSTVGIAGLNGLKVPFIQRGFEPQNSTLKLGPIFIKIWRVEGATLFSDNINLTEKNREPGVIAILRMDMGVICQLGEGFQLAIAGSFVYLPIQGKIGPAGYGLSSLLGLGVEPIVSCQMTYDTMLGGWDVQFFDELRTGIVQFSNSINVNMVAIQGASFPWEDRAGVYAFGAPTGSKGTSSADYRYNTANDNQQYLSNTVGLQATRVLPSDVRLTVRAVNQNFWYNQNGRGMPNTRDAVDVQAASVRENLRFKPFVDYSASLVNPGSDLFQQVSVGAAGPITDQLSVYASMGYFYKSNGYQSLLWDLEFTHVAGPNTTESLIFSRSSDLFGQEISSWAGYRLTQVLGPSMTGYFFAGGAKVEDLTGGNNSFNDFISGILVTYFVSPRTDISVVGIYQYEEYPYYKESLNVWTGRFDLAYHFTDTLIGRLVYQYRNRNTNIPNNGFYENMVFLSLSKYFP